MAGPTRPTAKTPYRRSEKQVLRDKLLAHRVRVTGKSSLPTIPGIQGFASMTREIDGGRQRILELIQLAQLDGRDAAERWWFVFQDLTITQRQEVSFDDVCAASGVKPRDLIVAMLDAVYDNAIPASKLVRAAMLPKVTSVLVQSALRSNSEIGERDRQRFLQMEGMLPTPKGTIVNVAANAQAAASAALDPSVPSFADDMRIVRAPRELPPVDAVPADE